MVGTGSNETEGRKVIDATVGGLVWVRRRNGSWWPGQIVGLDELPENGLASPRSGTPIKLLGRDDSSVELHDLEKTKGVKAFRCGDYDSCIEKAKASAATSLKRSLKYPRRENAIICALQIETSRLHNNGPNLQSPSNNTEGLPNHAEGSTTMSRPSRDSNCLSEESSSEGTSSSCEENSNSTQELSYSGISFEETNESTCKGKPFKGKRRKTPNDSDDDGSEGIKRMKGLDDLGIGADKKIQVLALADTDSQSNVSLNNFRDANCTFGSVSNGGSMLALKRKRSQVVHIHELLKRKYRRRPLTKVLENTAMVPVRIICDEFATPFERSDAISPSYECENTNKVKDAELFKEQLPGDDSSYVLFDVPFVDEDLHSSGYSPIRQLSSPSKSHTISFRGGSSRNVQGQASSSGHEALNESCPVYSTVACVNQKMEKGASKWQSKGKRNARHLTKTEQTYSRKKVVDIDYKNSDAYAIGLEDPVRFSPSSSGLLNGFTDRKNPISITSSQRSFSYQARFFVHPAFEMPDVPSRGIYADSSLYEVEISVEATRPQAQQVPYISLMSKLSGKPITGHPVAVEVLEDGFCDLQMSDHPASSSCELDENDTKMGPIVEPKAPRRTKHIILRPHFSCKKSSKSKKKKKQKHKHKHGSSSKKTRKLSSLTGPHKLNPEKRKPMVQNPKGPTLACVPLKVVFSRINEALNGSTRSAHRAVTLNNT